MSDVGIRLDGLIALLAVLAAGGVLLLSFVLCAVRGWLGSRRAQVSIRTLPVYGHIAGSLAGGLGCGCVGLTIFLDGRSPPPHTLEAWLDRWLFLWLPAVLLLWPVTAARIKRRQAARSPG